MTCPKGAHMHTWTDEERGYLAEIAPGHSHAEIREMMTERFGDHFGGKRIAAAIKRYGLRTGRTGWFAAGRVPANKGKTWDEQGLSEETRERMRRGQFQPGQSAPNKRPVGSERVGKGGYILVKVRDEFDPEGYGDWRDLWKPKHRWIWEQEHGPLPKGRVIVFADQDKANFDPDNLVAMSRARMGTITRLGLTYHDAESLAVASRLAELHTEIYRRGREPRVCKTCGKTFNPDQPRQVNCRSCIDKRREQR